MAGGAPALPQVNTCGIGNRGDTGDPSAFAAGILAADGEERGSRPLPEECPGPLRRLRLAEPHRASSGPRCTALRVRTAILRPDRKDRRRRAAGSAWGDSTGRSRRRGGGHSSGGGVCERSSPSAARLPASKSSEPCVAAVADCAGVHLRERWSSAEPPPTRRPKASVPSQENGRPPGSRRPRCRRRSLVLATRHFFGEVRAAMTRVGEMTVPAGRGAEHQPHPSRIARADRALDDLATDGDWLAAHRADESGSRRHQH